MIPLLVIFGVLTKRNSINKSCSNNSVYGSGDNSAGSIAAVTVVFIFCGVYSVAWTPLSMCYSPEVLNFTCRAIGMAAYSFTSWSTIVFVSFVFPFGLNGIGWKFYLVNAGWDVVQVKSYPSETDVVDSFHYVLLCGNFRENTGENWRSIRRCFSWENWRQCIWGIFEALKRRYIANTFDNITRLSLISSIPEVSILIHKL